MPEMSTTPALGLCLRWTWSGRLAGRPQKNTAKPRRSPRALAVNDPVAVLGAFGIAHNASDHRTTLTDANATATTIAKTECSAKSCDEIPVLLLNKHHLAQDMDRICCWAAGPGTRRLGRWAAGLAPVAAFGSQNARMVEGQDLR